MNLYKIFKKVKPCNTYKLIDLDKIRLNISKEHLKKLLKDMNLSISEEEAVRKLKEEILFKRIKNKAKAFPKILKAYDLHIKEMFPTFFWEEYLFTRKSNISYEHYIDYIKKMYKIKSFLDSNKKYQGICGNLYQQSSLYKRIKDMTGLTFSMRGWGSIMSAYMNSRKKDRIYSYIDFYYEVKK